MGLIQTPQQLQFCWKTIADALQQGVLTEKIKCDDENFVKDESGEDLLAGTNNHINGEIGEMSQENQMENDLSYKSCDDLSSLRKRASTGSYETDRDTKHSKRFPEMLFF